MAYPTDERVDVTAIASSIVALEDGGMKRTLPILIALLGLTCSMGLLGRIALADSDGLEITQGGSGLLVKLINPKDGAAAVRQGYAVDKGDCNNGTFPCYIFSAVNGVAPLPVQAQPCVVATVGKMQTAYCGASGVSSVTIEATRGGTIGRDASGDSDMGKRCFPVPVHYKAGGGVYSILAHDGCHNTVTCLDNSFGTVDADAGDSVDSKCKYVQRH